MSTSKPKLTQVTDQAEIDEIRRNVSDLSTPFYYFNRSTGHLWVDADELRVWREKRASQRQSEAEQK